LGAGEDKGCLGELLAEYVAARGEEFLGTVDGERVGDAEGAGGDAAGGGDVTSAVDVEVGEGAAAEPVGEEKAVHHVEPCVEELGDVGAGAGGSGDVRAQDDERASELHAQEREEIVRDDAREGEECGAREDGEGGGGFGGLFGGEGERRVGQA